METIPISEIRSGGDLFFCEPYNCKLLARACVERQAKASLGLDAITLLKCKRCSLGDEVKQRAIGVVIDESALLHSARRSGHHRNGDVGKKLRGAPVNPIPPIESPKIVEEKPIEAPQSAASKNPDAVTLGRLGGLKGGKARAAALSPEERAAAAKKAADARWASKIPSTPTKQAEHVADVVLPVAPEPAPPPPPAPETDDLCDHGTPMGVPCKKCQETEPLTRAKLERAMVVYGQYWGSDDKAGEAVMDEWTEFFHEHGAELIALSLAAIGRLEPRQRSSTLSEKHILSAAQKEVLALISDGKPRSVSEIAAQMGRNYQNTRNHLAALQARGLARNERDTREWKGGKGGPSVWVSASSAPAGKIIHPQRCELDDVPDYCGKHASYWITFGDGKPQAACSDCVDGLRDVGVFDDGDATLTEIALPKALDAVPPAP